MGHIYTKSGDKGETALLGGKRVSKNEPRITAIGEIDELNAVVGVMRGNDILKQIQDDLFCIGAALARGQESKKAPARTPRIKSQATPGITAARTQSLEKEIDRIEAKLPPLKNFILPGGTPFAAQAHLARAVCRRAERALVALAEKETFDLEILKYVNRLSDLLFMMAREDNWKNGIKEEKWTFHQHD